MPQTGSRAGVEPTTDLSTEEAIPYFLWDQPMTVGELRRRLSGPPEERYRFLGTILREAREPDVWRFTTPEEVVPEWDRMLRAGSFLQPGKDACLDLLLGHRSGTPQSLAQQLLRVVEEVERNPQMLTVRELGHRPQ